MQNHKGFTLIEMIMVIILIGIVAAVIAVPLSQGVKGWFQATSREGISQSGRIGIERMTREIRNTAKVYSVTALCAVPPCPCISAATDTSFSFSDSSGNLTTCASITFTLSVPNITRTDASGTFNLADNIQSTTTKIFTYYDSSNAVTTTPANVRRVAIEIASTQGGETLRKYNEVYLSNMKGY